MVHSFRLSCLIAALVACVLVLAGSVQADPPYWHRMVVDSGGSGCGRYCSLAFDPNGDPAIVYIDGEGAGVSGGDLVCSRLDRESGVWNTSVIPSPNHLGRCTLKFQPNGYPAVSFAHLAPNDLWGIGYAWEDAGGWNVRESIYDMSVYAPPLGRVALGFDGSGGPWVAESIDFLTLAFIVYATPETSPGGDWAIGIADHTAAGPTYGLGQVSLAMGPTGWPRISYDMVPYAGYFPMKYASYDPPAPIDPNVQWPNQVIYAPDPNEGMDPNTMTGYPCLAFDGAGTPSVACTWHEKIGVQWSDWIAWAVRDVGGWTITKITDEISLDANDVCCLAFRGDGKPGITFRGAHEGQNKPLMYAWLDPNDVWQIRSVDWIGDVGRYHSLGTDPNGLPAVAYYDATEGLLIYAETSDVPDTYTLTLGTTQGGGTVEADPNVNPDWGAYAYGTVVTLTGVPDENRAFSRWLIYDPNHPSDPNHAAQDSNNPTQILMDRDRQVDAVFICVTGGGLGLPLGFTMLVLALAKVGVRTREFC